MCTRGGNTPIVPHLASRVIFQALVEHEMRFLLLPVALVLLLVGLPAIHAVPTLGPGVLAATEAENGDIQLSWWIPIEESADVVHIHGVNETGPFLIATLTGTAASFTTPKLEGVASYYMTYEASGQQSMPSNPVPQYPNCWAFVTYSIDPVDVQVNDHCFLP